MVWKPKWWFTYFLRNVKIVARYERSDCPNCQEVPHVKINNNSHSKSNKEDSTLENSDTLDTVASISSMRKAGLETDGNAKSETEGQDTRYDIVDTHVSKDPKSEAIKARVRQMEEGAAKLKQMQSEVDKQMTSPAGSTSPANYIPQQHVSQSCR